MKTNQTMLLMSGLAIAAMIATTAFRIGSDETAPVIRASKIELVDSKGTVRASLKIEEEGEAGGTAMLRIFDSSGTIRVKLGGGSDGSGMVLLNDGPDVGFHVTANKEGTQVTLANKDGKKKQLLPE